MAETFYDKVTKKFGTSESVSRPLATYVAQSQTDKGIHLPRQRYVIVAEKNA
jgi:hypothetical protein